VPAVTAVDERLKGVEVEDLAPFGLLDHPNRLPQRQYLGVVEQRAGEAGDGDGVELGAVIWVQ
jgi:hypothetical protein